MKIYKIGYKELPKITLVNFYYFFKKILKYIFKNNCQFVTLDCKIYKKMFNILL